jgi:thiamine pyrophosphokinase
MTLANLMLLSHPALQLTRLRLIDGNQQISLLGGGQTLQIQGTIGDTVSLIPLSQVARGITTCGLEYCLRNGTLTLGSPRGVSNVIVGEQCQISLEEGILVIVHIRQAST